MPLPKLLQTFNRWLFGLVAVPFTLVSLLTVIDVSGRYFRHPSQGTMQIAQLGLAVIIASGLAHAQAFEGKIGRRASAKEKILRLIISTG